MAAQTQWSQHVRKDLVAAAQSQAGRSLHAHLGGVYLVLHRPYVQSSPQRYEARDVWLRAGGYQRILTTLAAELQKRGVTILTASPVEKIVHDTADGKLRVMVPKRDETLQFDRVVTTVPSPIISRSCPQLNADEQRRLGRPNTWASSVHRCCWIVLWVVTTSRTLPTRGFPLTGVIEMGSIVDPKYLGGNYLVYLPRYLLADDPALSEPDDSIHERCLSTLEKMYPNFNRSQVRAIQTARAKHVMALPTLNYSQHLPRL